MVRIVVAMLALLIAACGRAAPPELLLDATEARTPLGERLHYLEDRGGRYDLDRVREDHGWVANEGGAFNQGYSRATWWLRTRIVNSSDKSQKRLLELAYPVLDRVEVYVVSGDSTKVIELGDKLPFNQRPIDHRFFLVPLEWAPGEALDIYLRIRSSGIVQAPLTLWERSAFASHDSSRSVLQGLFYGTMLVIAAYNLLLYLALRDRTYLYYVAFVVSALLFLASLGGQAFRYLWPTMTHWNDYAIVVFLCLGLAFGVAFTYRFLRLPGLIEFLVRARIVLMLLAMLPAALTLILPFRSVLMALMGTVVLAVPAALTVGLYAWRGGQGSARYYVFAWGATLAGGLLLILNKVDLMPVNVLTEYSAYFGISVAALLLSFGLAERINTERRLRFEAQAGTLRATQRANAELERRVKERTQELEALNRQLEVLSNTDQLTGLRNRRYLEQRLAEEWARGVRSGRALAVALIDIDHFKQFNDRYGHAAGDACLREVARRIEAGVRWPGDEAARYGGEEFCLLLPETDAEGACAVAERVRRAVEREPVVYEGQALAVTISVGVSTVQPGAELALEQLLRCADQALYASKEHGRNRITLYGDTLAVDGTGSTA